jgi:hypothetical protein
MRTGKRHGTCAGRADSAWVAQEIRGAVMNGAVSDVVVGLLMAVLGLVGLFLAAGAVDDEMYIFGLGLAGLAVLFDIGIVKAHFDRRDAARQAARGGHKP